jgi:hypothetical protein
MLDEAGPAPHATAQEQGNFQEFCRSVKRIEHVIKIRLPQPARMIARQKIFPDG